MKHAVICLFFLCTLLTGRNLQHLISEALKQNLDYQISLLERENRLNTDYLEQLSYEFIPSVSGTYNRGSSFDQYYDADEEAYQTIKTETETFSYKAGTVKKFTDQSVIDIDYTLNADLSSFASSRYTEEYGFSISRNISGMKRNVPGSCSHEAEKIRIESAENAAVIELFMQLCDCFRKISDIRIRKNSLSTLKQMDEEYRKKAELKLIRKSEYQSVSLNLQEALLQLEKLQDEYRTGLKKLNLLTGDSDSPSDNEISDMIAEITVLSETIVIPDAEIIKKSISERSITALENEILLKKAEAELENIHNELPGTISLNGDFHRRGQGESREESGKYSSRRWQIGLSYNLEIDRRRLKAEIRNRQRDFEILKLSMKKNRKNMQQTADDYVSELKSRELGVKIARSSEEKLSLELEDVELRFRNKLIPAYEYLEKRNAYDESAASLLSARIDLAVYKLQIFGEISGSIARITDWSQRGDQK